MSQQRDISVQKLATAAFLRSNPEMFRGLDGKPGKGEQGERGEKGEKGDKGDRGLPGKNGEDGKDGRDGKPGPDGKAGAPGVNGENGRDAQELGDDDFNVRVGKALRGGMRLGYSVSGPPGQQGETGAIGPAGTTDYNLLTNLPILGSVASTAASLYTLAADIGSVASTAASTYALAASITGSTYTPALSNVANLDGSTSFTFQYTAVNGMVTVSGRVQIDPTFPAILTQLGIALPVASNLAASSDVGGVAFATNIAGQGAAILADTANDQALMQYVSGDITAQPMAVMFQYRIL